MKAGGLAVLAAAIAIPVLLAMPARHALADVARPDTARVASACHLSKPDTPTGSAKLAFTLPYTDEPGWTSTVTVTVPTSWPFAADLLMNPASGAFQFADNCLFVTEAPETTSVSLGNGDITVQTVTRGEISDWDLRLPYPWTASDASNLPLEVAFSPVGAFSRVSWKTASVSAQGFTVTSPKPLPVSDDADSSVYWNDPAPSATAPYSIALHPHRLLSMELTAETGPGEGQYAPYDGEEAAFAFALALLLSRRRRNRVEVPRAVGAPAKLLCVTAAILALVQF